MRKNTCRKFSGVNILGTDTFSILHTLFTLVAVVMFLQRIFISPCPTHIFPNWAAVTTNHTHPYAPAARLSLRLRSFMQKVRADYRTLVKSRIKWVTKSFGHWLEVGRQAMRLCEGNVREMSGKCTERWFALLYFFYFFYFFFDTTALWIYSIL